MLFPGEVESVKQALAIGRRYGYGNLIAHLRREWALGLMRDHGMTWEQATRGALTDPYPAEFGIDEMVKADAAPREHDSSLFGVPPEPE